MPKAEGCDGELERQEQQVVVGRIIADPIGGNIVDDHGVTDVG